MNAARPLSPLPRSLRELLDSPLMAATYASTSIGVIFCATLITRVMSPVAYGTIMIGLVALGAAILVVRRAEIRTATIMPLTLMAFIAWALVSLSWSRAPATSFSGWLLLAGPTALAVVVAHTRDTLQVIRATADVLRVLLVVSFALEVLSGILIDTPLPLIGVAGNLAVGGPIQGIFGSRTQLGLVLMIAIVTFLVEWRTNSVRPGLTAFSVVLALLLAVFTASPIIAILAAISAAATGVLAIVRRVRPATRRPLQWSIAGAGVVLAFAGYLFRQPIIHWLNVEPDFAVRSRIRNVILDMVEVQPVQGWGWFGHWPNTTLPFTVINYFTERHNGSALNAFLDVLLQLGWLGLVLFLVFVLTALSRAWLTASEKRSTLYTWPALILIVLLADGFADSALLWNFAWFMLVLCATRTSLERGWRPEGSLSATP